MTAHVRGRVALVLVLLVAAWLRAPFVTSGVPFFYLEDEAHHFQRTVEMVKRGTFDPGYFNKPSLHFYLRMPVVAASFIAAVRAGELRSVKEIVTRSAVPGRGWSFTASHPRLLVWNRMFGVVLGLLIVVLTFALALELTGAPGLAAGAALLSAVSPALAADAAKVGVDTPLVLMCLFAIWLALRLQARFTYGRLVAAGLVAGLAVSTKYNAAPIALLPLAACLLGGRRDAGPILLALALPVAGFLAGTPYALLDLPAFLDDVAYEAWHYGTAGHSWATGRPGLPQAWFFLRWFAGSAAIGLLAVVFAAVGALALARRRDRSALAFFLFPVLFLALMSAQKANFTRNVLVLLPVIAILAAVAVREIAARVRWGWIATLAFAAAAVQPGIAAIAARRQPPPDSRLIAARWLGQAAGPRSETVVASELAWPVTGPGTSRLTTIDTARIAPLALYMGGFDRLVVDSSFVPDTSGTAMLRQEHASPGAPGGARVVISPEVRIFRLEPPAEAELERWLSLPGAAVAPMVQYGDGRAVRAGGAAHCADERTDDPAPPDGGCWVRTRASRLVLDARALAALPASAAFTIDLELESPWPGQRCTLQSGAWRSPDFCAGQSAATRFATSTTVPASAVRSSAALTLHVGEVHSLRDERKGRVGLAVRAVRIR